MEQSMICYATYDDTVAERKWSMLMVVEREMFIIMVQVPNATRSCTGSTLHESHVAQHFTRNYKHLPSLFNLSQWNILSSWFDHIQHQSHHQTPPLHHLLIHSCFLTMRRRIRVRPPARGWRVGPNTQGHRRSTSSPELSNPLYTSSQDPLQADKPISSSSQDDIHADNAIATSSQDPIQGDNPIATSSQDPI